MKKWLSFFLAALLTVGMTACGGAAPIPDAEFVTPAPVESELPEVQEPTLDEDGSYTSAEDVGLYLYLYGQLPQNFMTKKEARDLGWPGGRTWYECDINTLGKDDRGPERIVYSNDGLIYYTPDHYLSFELMYGEE